MYYEELIKRKPIFDEDQFQTLSTSKEDDRLEKGVLSGTISIYILLKLSGKLTSLIGHSHMPQ